MSASSATGRCRSIVSMSTVRIMNLSSIDQTSRMSRRVSVAALMGLFVGIFLGFEWWNWSNFPACCTRAYVVVVFLDWFVADLAMPPL